MVVQIGGDTVQNDSLNPVANNRWSNNCNSESGTDVLTGSGSGKLNFTLNSQLVQ